MYLGDAVKGDLRQLNKSNILRNWLISQFLSCILKAFLRITLLVSRLIYIVVYILIFKRGIILWDLGVIQI